MIFAMVNDNSVCTTCAHRPFAACSVPRAHGKNGRDRDAIGT